MDLKTEALKAINATEKFFNMTTAELTEADSGFRPRPEMMTAAQQVAHAAQVIDWIRVGAFDGAWDMDFEASQRRVNEVSSLAAARATMREAWERLRETTRAASNEELAATMADNPILPGRPRYHAYEALIDHTGHHRGALSVYLRLLGRVPGMPYAE